MINLKEITMENFHDVINLKLSDTDKTMVASNMYSLAEAFADKVSICKAIYHDETLVGFIMFDYNQKEHKGYISRLMIEDKHQGNGFGTQALEMAIEQLIKNKDIERIQISYHPDNIKAKKSYAKVGFIETGDFVDGEAIAIIDV